METLAVIPLVVLYFVIKAIIFGTDDKLDKEKKKFATGIKMVNNKDFVNAKAWFDQKISEFPKSGLGWAYRGQCNLALGNIYEALSDLTKACNLESNLPEAYLNKGKALYLLTDYDNAFIELDKAVWHFRDNAEAYRYRGLVLIKMGNTLRGQNDLKMAVTLGDEDANQMIRQQKAFNNGLL